MSQEQTGVVKVVFADKGFGFIRPDAGGDDVWFHVQGHGNAEAAGLSAGDAVTYELAPGRNGRPQGVRMRAVAGGAARGAAGAGPSAAMQRGAVGAATTVEVEGAAGQTEGKGLHGAGAGAGLASQRP